MPDVQISGTRVNRYNRLTNFKILLDSLATACYIRDHLRALCDRRLQQFGVRELGDDVDDIVEKRNYELLQRF